MSFQFKWPTFSKEFHRDAANMLDGALNKGNKPKVIADDIKVKELGMGTIPPELEILEIGDLSTDRFRGIFRLKYAGDAHIVLSTKVQANPLSKASASAGASLGAGSSLFPSSPSASASSRGILFAAAPLIVPMHLRLSNVRLRAIVVLVVSKTKGITLVFKNDPLEAVEVSSTFDSVAVIQKYLQQEIETQLREMFREDLPGIIHRLSQRWLSGQADKKKEEKQVPAPAPAPPPSSSPERSLRQPLLPKMTADLQAAAETASAPGGSPRTRHRVRANEIISSSASEAPDRLSSSKARLSRKSGRGSTPKAASSKPSQLGGDLPSDSRSSYLSSYRDIEEYDPTYGLRPDDLPTHSGYSGLGRLAGRPMGGLRDLTSLQPDTVSSASRSRSPRYRETDGEEASEHGSDYEPEEVPEHGVVTPPFEGTFPQPHTSPDPEDDDDVEDAVFGPIDDDGDVSDDPDHVVDYSRYGYPPPSAAFSDMQESATGPPSVFEPSTKARSRGTPSRVASSLASAKGSQRSASSSARAAPVIEYDTLPAVGGGTVSQPRVYHAASHVRAPIVYDDDDDLEEAHGERTLHGSDFASGATSTAHAGDAMSRSFSGTSRGLGGLGPAFNDEDEEDDDDDGNNSSRSPPSLGTLATLPPEPMDERSYEYRTQVYRHRYGATYRPGYGSSKSSAASAHGRTISDGMSEVPAQPTSSAPTSQYPSAHGMSRSSSRNDYFHTNSGETVTAAPGTHSMPTSPRGHGAELSASPGRGSGMYGHQSSSPKQPPALPKMTSDASAHFASLVASNHTLSPYTLSLETKGLHRSSPAHSALHGHSGSSTPSSAAGGSVSPVASMFAAQSGSTSTPFHAPGGPSYHQAYSSHTPQRPSLYAQSSHSTTNNGSTKPPRRRTFQLPKRSDSAPDAQALKGQDAHAPSSGGSADANARPAPQRLNTSPLGGAETASSAPSMSSAARRSMARNKSWGSVASSGKGYAPSERARLVAERWGTIRE